jgi:hypothetical protein
MPLVMGGAEHATQAMAEPSHAPELELQLRVMDVP